MKSHPASPPQWPLDDQWLTELEELLLVETATSSASLQPSTQVPAQSSSPSKPRLSNSSEDGDEERALMSEMPDRRRDYRQKKRRELLELRETTVELQAQLHELLQRRKGLESTLSNSTRLAAGWRGVALRQIQRRLAAETLNTELRAHIRNHHDAAVRLMEALRAQTTIGSKRTLEMTEGEPSKPVMQLNEKDWNDLSILLRDIDVMCAQASTKVQQAQMPLLEKDKTYNSRLSRGSEMSGVQSATFAETMVMPFPVEDAIPAMDKAFPIVVGSEYVPAISNVSEDGSTMAVKTMWGPFVVLSVFKLVKGSGYADMAWRSIIRERGQPVGPVISEYGWGRTAAANESGMSTQLHLLSHWSAEQAPSHEAGTVVPYAHPLDRFIQMYVGSSESDAAELAQKMENVIVDKMVARKQW